VAALYRTVDPGRPRHDGPVGTIPRDAAGGDGVPHEKRLSPRGPPDRV